MKAVHIIRREYRESVSKKSFIIGTVLVPLFMLAFFAIPIALTEFTPDKQYHAVMLDATGEIGAEFAAALQDTLKNGELKYLVQVHDVAPGEMEADRDRWVTALRADEVDMIVIVDESVFDEGRARYITIEERGFQILEDFENALTDVVIKRRLARKGLDYSVVKELATSVRLDLSQVTASGDVKDKSFLAEWGVVFVFVMILYTALMTWGLAISRGIVEEKGSRVIEVLLSSIPPRDLLIGKVVGLGLAGLTQMAIWGAVGLALSSYAAVATAEVLKNVTIEPVVFVYFIVFFLLGFLLYASIFTVVGSMCSSEQDAQQLQGIVTMPLIVPIIVLMFIVQSPNGAVSVVLSLIPLFAPMIMLARVILLEPPLWQVLLSIVLLVLSIVGAVEFSARIFRVGILMYGKRPDLRELIRWYKFAK
ncbi:MAG TPA: ABC transporter permease [Chromatiales bacterium]|nr:ABC transporter permease [Chromatiales bacterium]